MQFTQAMVQLERNICSVGQRALNEVNLGASSRTHPWHTTSIHGTPPGAKGTKNSSESPQNSETDLVNLAKFGVLGAGHRVKSTQRDHTP